MTRVGSGVGVAVMRCLMVLLLQDEWGWWPARGVEARGRVNDDGLNPRCNGQQGSRYGHNRNRMHGDDNRIDKDIELQKRGRMRPIATCLYGSAGAFVRGRPFRASVSTTQDGGCGSRSVAGILHKGHGEDRDL